MIHLKNITKSVGEKILFEHISFKIGERQKVGLIGPNGVGKTTLLNLIADKEEADRGLISTETERIGYLTQKLITDENEEVGRYLRQFLIESWEDYKIDIALAEVGLAGLNKKTLINKLSGGQKMKVGLATLLLKEPTALLLDEPTNNLDLESLKWLEEFVKSFSGKILLVSHDRFFLDACVNKIIELDTYTHQINEYGGNYSAYKIQKELRQQNLLSDFQLQEQQESHMHDWIVEKQEQLKFHPNPKVGKQLQAMKKKFERKFVDEKIVKPKTYQAFNIEQLGQKLHQGKSIFSLHNFSIYDLIQADELYIFGQERIQLAGQNGAGKSTFLKSIVGQFVAYTGTIEIGPEIKLGYFSQEHELLQEDQSVINVFMSQTKIFEEATVRKILGKFLFTQQKVFSLIQFLSEGEKARLLLAIIIHQQNDFLLLDEPTNHLDLESREVLAEALKNYQGGFMVVSHDRYFLEQIEIQRVLKIKNGVLE